MSRHKTHIRRGFTLIEVIVSVGIFSIVMVIALGSLLSISAAERKAETLKSVMNNLNFALESMSRTIRTGHTYSYSAASGFSFVPADETMDFVIYRHFSDSDDASTCGQTAPVGCIARYERINDDGVWIPLTSPEVIIEKLDFYLRGAVAGDRYQPKVTIVVSGYVQVTATQRSQFTLQTTVTQRKYDSS